MRIRELPSGERPREKMQRHGSAALSSGELLAILLRTGTREKTALALAEELLAMDPGGLRHLANCTIEELSRLHGIGPAKACQIKAAVELGRRIATMPREPHAVIRCTEDAVGLFMETMRYYPKEHFRALLLSAKGEIIAEETISIGDLSTSIVHPRESFAGAIRRSAAAVLFVHNHPSGDPQPSRDDIEVTKRLCEAGRILGIRVLDHIIIGDGRWISMKADGMME
ncbi:MAG: RadC family protein [Anaerovoracaceae bacterium]